MGSITVTVALLFFLQNAVTGNKSPKEFSRSFGNYRSSKWHYRQRKIVFELIMHFTGRPRFGSVRLRFGDGTVQAVPVFGSGGSSAKRVVRCFSRV